MDASVLVEFLGGGPNSRLVDERLSAEEHTLWAPHLVDAEIGQALRRRVRQGRLDVELARGALREVQDLPIERVEHELLIHVAWDLRENFSFYDALYVALALMLDEPLLTFDARLARAGAGTGAALPIEVLA
ncbi:MAG TPA: type II toxin-antitoxin system VapC family toxin [Solirubrobacterales bacterium]|nr:type II toxin-antitoxin system VapC family toxin [Solirubrobacterales bacterium]